MMYTYVKNDIHVNLFDHGPLASSTILWCHYFQINNHVYMNSMNLFSEKLSIQDMSYHIAALSSDNSF